MLNVPNAVFNGVSLSSDLFDYIAFMYRVGCLQNIFQKTNFNYQKRSSEKTSCSIHECFYRNSINICIRLINLDPVFEVKPLGKGKVVETEKVRIIAIKAHAEVLKLNNTLELEWKSRN